MERALPRVCIIAREGGHHRAPKTHGSICPPTVWPVPLGPHVGTIIDSLKLGLRDNSVSRDHSGLNIPDLCGPCLAPCVVTSCVGVSSLLQGFIRREGVAPAPSWMWLRTQQGTSEPTNEPTHCALESPPSCSHKELQVICPGPAGRGQLPANQRAGRGGLFGSRPRRVEGGPGMASGRRWHLHRGLKRRLRPSEEVGEGSPRQKGGLPRGGGADSGQCSSRQS